MKVTIENVEYELAGTELGRVKPGDNRRRIVTTNGTFLCTPMYDKDGQEVKEGTETEWATSDLPAEIIKVTWDCPDLTEQHLTEVHHWYEEYIESAECPTPTPSFKEYRRDAYTVIACWREFETPEIKEASGYRDLYEDAFGVMAGLRQRGQLSDDSIFEAIRGLTHEVRKKGKTLLWLCDMEFSPTVAQTPATPAESGAVAGVSACAKGRRKGRPPATPAERAADEKVFHLWQEYRRREADENRNKKPSLDEFAPTIGMTNNLVRAALGRVAKRRKRHVFVTAK